MNSENKEDAFKLKIIDLGRGWTLHLSRGNSRPQACHEEREISLEIDHDGDLEISHKATFEGATFVYVPIDVITQLMEANRTWQVWCDCAKVQP